MIRERQNGCHIWSPPRVSDHSTTNVCFRTSQFRLSDTIRFGAAASLRNLSTSSVFVACEYRGVQCMELYRIERMPLAKSNDKFVRATRKSLARVVLRLLQRLCGLSRQPRTSQPSLEKTSAPAPVGCPANSNLPASCLPPSSPKLRAAIRRRPF